MLTTIKLLTIDFERSQSVYFINLVPLCIKKYVCIPHYFWFLECSYNGEFAFGLTQECYFFQIIQSSNYQSHLELTLNCNRSTEEDFFLAQRKPL